MPRGRRTQSWDPQTPADVDAFLLDIFGVDPEGETIRKAKEAAREASENRESENE